MRTVLSRSARAWFENDFPTEISHCIATKFQSDPKHLRRQNEEPIHVREVLSGGAPTIHQSGEFSMGTDQNRPGQQGGQGGQQGGQQGQRGGQGQQSGQGSQQGRPGQGGQQKPGQQQGGQKKDMDE
jgi:hypothetical protein